MHPSFPDDLLDERRICNERYRLIVAFEDYLHHTAIRIIKLVLHPSKDEPRKRFIERRDETDKNRKFSPSDVHERKCWKHYRNAEPKPDVEPDEAPPQPQSDASPKEKS